MIMKMLVPVNDSASSAAALAHAIELAECTNATLVLMSVIQPATTWVAGPFGAVAELLEADSRVEHEAHQRLLRLAAEAVPDGIAFRIVLAEGDPAKQIIRQLEHGDYDLVVLGSRGLGSVKSVLMGGVSRQVLERVETPTLVIRADAKDRPITEHGEELASTATARQHAHT